MKCVICKNGETQPGTATVTLEREGMTLVIQGVPAMVCANCGEEYVDEDTGARLLKEVSDETLRTRAGKARGDSTHSG